MGCACPPRNTRCSRSPWPSSSAKASAATRPVSNREAEWAWRRGFSPGALLALTRAYRTLYKSGLMLDEARAKLEEEVKLHPEIQPILDFLAVSKRGIIR